jgi:exodeoxyribonuclease VII small subunit
MLGTNEGGNTAFRLSLNLSAVYAPRSLNATVPPPRVDRRATRSLQCRPRFRTHAVKRKNTLNFEATLLELESLVERLERGDLSLEESMLQFERGLGLARACQQALRAAEQKIQLLTRSAQGENLSDFEPEPDDEIE